MRKDKNVRSQKIDFKKIKIATEFSSFSYFIFHFNNLNLLFYMSELSVFITHSCEVT